MAVGSWEMMQAGDTEGALRCMQDEFAKAWNPEYSMPSLSEVMELGVGYLWIDDFEAAFDHFNFVNQRYPRHAHCTYDMAGTAMWCMGNRIAAVDQWQRGLDVDYADLGYGFSPPLLLFFASIVEPNLFSRAEAETLLAKRLDDPRANRWPASLAEFVIGRIDFDALRQKGIDKNDENWTAFHHWLADFWRGVLELEHGNAVGYRELMRQTANVSWVEYDRDKRAFLGKLWCPECYLARHEAQ
jgi:lipoprotein NlpI